MTVQHACNRLHATKYFKTFKAQSMAQRACSVLGLRWSKSQRACISMNLATLLVGKGSFRVHCTSSQKGSSGRLIMNVRLTEEILYS